MFRLFLLVGLLLLTTAALGQTTAKDWAIKGYAATDAAEKIRCYTEAIRLDPQYALAYNNRGLAKSDLGRNQEAIADYDEAIRLDPKYVDAYSNRGLAKYDLGHYQDALADHNEAIRLDPKRVKTYYDQGIAKKALGRYQDALSDFDEAIRLDPQYALAYLVKGRALVNLNRCSEALELFRQGEALNSTYTFYLDDKKKAEACATPTPVVTSPVSAGSPVASPGKRYALVIGNGSYKFVASLARQPRTDAEVMAQRLRDLGFQVTDGYDLKTKSDLEATIFDFADKARNADMLVVYYAGHGMEFNGVNYLIPTEARIERDERAELEALSLDYLIDRMGRCRPRLSLVLLDACRNNPFTGRSRDLGDGDYRAMKISGTAPPRNMMVLYATQPGRMATNAGVFADALKEHLRRGTRLTEFMMNVTNTVDERTRQQQSPYQSGTLFTDFTF